MSITRRTLTALIALTLLAAACGDTGSTGTTTPPTTAPPTTGTPTTLPPEAIEVRSDIERAIRTDITDEELAALVDGNRDFAFELFRLVAGDENSMISPYSVAAALTMTYAGARGETAAEIRDALRFGLPDDRLHAARNELDLRITDTEPAGEDEPTPFTINVANSLWGQSGYPFLEEFLDLLAENYDAGMNLVDFVAAAEDARTQINDWVEEQTEGRIVNLIPEGVLNDLTRLVLVNAIYFKANWLYQFDPANTTDGTFTTADGTEVNVPMMFQAEKMVYATGDGFSIVRIPYAGDASMVVVLPDEGRFDEVAASFGPDTLAALDAGTTHQVSLTMPKFEFRTTVNLEDALRAMGIEAAFTEPSAPGGADFTGITPERELFVHAVLQQSFVKVDEEGTEAAAATAVVIGTESLPPQATMTLDRPFLFVIEHGTTGEPLFVGQVLDPSA